MNFAQEVGKTQTRYVSAWTNPRGVRELGFGVEGKDFDPLLYGVLTPQQKKRLERRMELDAWDFHPQYEVDPECGSLRMYAYAELPPEPLVEDDLWEIQTVSCTYDADEKLTKDKRRKIRYGVKAVKRIVRISEWGDFENRRIIRETACGTNRSQENIPMDPRRARYQHNGYAIDVQQAIVDGKLTEHFNLLKTCSFSRLLDQVRGFEMRSDLLRVQKLRGELHSLPHAPQALVDTIPRHMIGW
jgi:hypothetical protein